MRWRIAHLADIHIQESRRDEYERVFKSLYASLKSLRPDVIVLAGDIFDSKTQASAHNIADVANFLIEISNIAPTVMITGNHDMNVRVPGSLDLLTPLVENISSLRSNILYMRETSARIAHGIIWVSAAIDGEIPDAKKAAELDPAAPMVFLFHEDLDGAAYQNGNTARSDRLTRATLLPYDLALGGHIHLRQKITPRAAYSGSLIQQNIGESHLNHGYIVWDIESVPPGAGAADRLEYRTLTPRAQKVNIHNDEGFARIEIDEEGIPQAEPYPTHPRYWEFVYPPDTPADIVEAIRDEYTAELGSVPRAVRIGSGGGDDSERGQTRAHHAAASIAAAQTAAMSLVEHERIIAGILGEDHPHLADVIARHRTRWSQPKVSETSRYRILRLEFDNMYAYGTGNVVDFTKLEGELSGIIAPNYSGKSSLVDILLFALYDEHPRTAKKTDIINAGASSCWLSLTFEINSRPGRIEKTFVRTRAKTGRAGYRLWFDNEELTQKDTPSTIAEMRKLLGDAETAKSTSFQLQGAENEGLPNRTPDKRKKLLADVLSLGVFSDLEKQEQQEYSELSGELRGLGSVADHAVLERTLQEKSKIKDEVSIRLSGITNEEKEAEDELATLSTIATRSAAALDAATDKASKIMATLSMLPEHRADPLRVKDAAERWCIAATLTIDEARHRTSKNLNALYPADPPPIYSATELAELHKTFIDAEAEETDARLAERDVQRECDARPMPKIPKVTHTEAKSKIATIETELQALSTINKAELAKHLKLPPEPVLEHSYGPLTTIENCSSFQWPVEVQRLNSPPSPTDVKKARDCIGASLPNVEPKMARQVLSQKREAIPKLTAPKKSITLISTELAKLRKNQPAATKDDGVSPEDAKKELDEAALNLRAIPQSIKTKLVSADLERLASSPTRDTNALMIALKKSAAKLDAIKATTALRDSFVPVKGCSGCESALNILSDAGELRAQKEYRACRAEHETAQIETAAKFTLAHISAKNIYDQAIAYKAWKDKIADLEASLAEAQTYERAAAKLHEFNDIESALDVLESDTYWRRKVADWHDKLNATADAHRARAEASLVLAKHDEQLCLIYELALVEQHSLEKRLGAAKKRAAAAITIKTEAHRCLTEAEGATELAIAGAIVWAKKAAAVEARSVCEQELKAAIQIQNDSRATSTTAMNNVANSKKRLASIRIQKATIAKAETTAMVEVARLTAIIEAEQAKQEKKKAIVQQMETIAAYRQVLKPKSGIADALLDRVRPDVEAAINEALRELGATFEIALTPEMGMEQRAAPGEPWLDVALASGYQRYATGLAARLALWRAAAAPLPDALVLDEGFGACDEGRLGALGEALAALPGAPSAPRLVFVVSHLSELKTRLRAPLALAPAIGRVSARIRNAVSVRPGGGELASASTTRAEAGVFTCGPCGRAVQAANRRRHEASAAHKRAAAKAAGRA